LKRTSQDIEELATECEKIGYPVIIKAAAGGGGRGMKIARSSLEVRELIASAQREAQSAFGNGQVFLEKYLDHAKHIEVQIFGDLTGQVVHLFERECSVQRRHQKVIEESLAPDLDPILREQITQAAAKLAKKVNYVGAGTVEFLVQDGKYYFMEMNTRLQVEHSVTELVMGVDLVKAQILIMMNKMALWNQKYLHPRGHSIECRIYAEDPYTEGVPSTGTLLYQSFPEGPGRRFDYGFEAGDVITPFYDSMIAKIIVWDESRPRAIMKMLATLKDTVIFGVKTNIPFLVRILEHPEFIDGVMTTAFISKHFPTGAPPAVALSEKEKLFLERALQAAPSNQDSDSLQIESPWSQTWRNT
jgi:acetyl/propionyl-CoA carboxylase alpha subunit